jgi:hypothetical protein
MSGDALSSFSKFFQSVIRNRLLQIFVALAIGIEIFNLAVAAYASTQKAREATAIAENAALRQKAEADIAEAKSITETEVARYAKQRQEAEAKRATALAVKTKYEAEVANADAAYAAIKAKAEVEAQEAQADLLSQQQQIQSQISSYAERRKYAEAEEAEAKASMAKDASALIAGIRSQPTADTIARQCSEKFESIWAEFLAFSNKWEGEAAQAKLTIHKARCGFTEAQIQRINKAQREILISLERDFCLSSPLVQQRNRAEIVKDLGHDPNCRSYTSAQLGNKTVVGTSNAIGSGEGGTIFRVISEVSGGKLNLRDGPGKGHSSIAEIPAGATLRQVGPCVRSDDGKTRDPWCKVEWNGRTGWASSSGLEKAQ